MPASEHRLPSPADSLEAEVRIAHALLTVLQQEQAHLIDASIPELETLTQEKSSLVAQLSSLAASRHEALAATGYQATESGMQYWMETRAEAVVADTWQTLLDAMRAAQEMNRTNGLLITTHLGHNQASLNVLQSKDSDSGNLYGPSGHASTRLAARGLIIG